MGHCATLVLALPAKVIEFTIYINVTRQGIGYDLMQDEKFIAYASRKLKSYEKSYPTHALKIGAVFFLLKIWRYYLCGSPDKILIDHKTLKYVFTQRELNF